MEMPRNRLQSCARIQMRNARVWIKPMTETMKTRASGYSASQWIKYNIRLELEGSIGLKLEFLVASTLVIPMANNGDRIERE
ncbi:small integral membrane protein 13 isoform X2 [Halichoerus grypus]